MSTFPEDSLTLLSPELTNESAEAFHARISGYYTERKKTHRLAPPKAPKLIGVTKRPAKKRELGIYEVSLGTKSFSFHFDKTKTIDEKVIGELTAFLNCLRPSALEFLSKKKFLHVEKTLDEERTET